MLVNNHQIIGFFASWLVKKKTLIVLTCPNEVGDYLGFCSYLGFDFLGISSFAAFTLDGVSEAGDFLWIFLKIIWIIVIQRNHSVVKCISCVSYYK